MTRMRVVSSMFAGGLAWLAAAGPALGETFNVPEQFATIQAAIFISWIQKTAAYFL